jgi:hypothetical protein
MESDPSEQSLRQRQRQERRDGQVALTERIGRNLAADADRRDDDGDADDADTLRLASALRAWRDSERQLTEAPAVRAAPPTTVVIVDRPAEPAPGLLWGAVERHRKSMSLCRACCIFCAVVWMLAMVLTGLFVVIYVVATRLPPPPNAINAPH